MLLNKTLNTKAVGGALFIGGPIGQGSVVQWTNTGQLPTLAQVTMFPYGVAWLAGSPLPPTGTISICSPTPSINGRPRSSATLNASVARYA